MIYRKRYTLIIILGLVLFVMIFKVKKNKIEDNLVVKPNPLVEESSDIYKGLNSEWWLNSGGKVFIEDNTIKTIQGDLPEYDSWRKRYFESNPTETDNGYHPQNIFRLVTRNKYENFTQKMYFKVNKYILSDDLHRSASNGVLFFHHYLDGDNLYYAGLRVDGKAVIKKKINGVYFTMIYQSVFSGLEYDRVSNPNLIPINTWMGIKSEIINLDNEKVSIKLYFDKDKSENWQLVAEAIDDGVTYGGKAILSSGYAGIRSDFMDVEFRNYMAETIGGNK